MKTWTDLSNIQLPIRLAAAPKDERGYPIPHTVHWIDGKPDFRVIDPEKWITAVKECRCGICGDVINGKMAFVGGPMSIENRLFTDLPMHQECAEYALQVCPFLAMPKFGYLERTDDGHVQVLESASSKRPDMFGLALTNSYQLAEIQHTGDIVLWAGPFSSIDWWVNGERKA